MTAPDSDQNAVLVTFRSDLRVADNPALLAAARSGRAVVPVFVWDPAQKSEGDWSLGAASRWWLHHSLGSLEGELRSLGARLLVRTGDPASALGALAAEVGAAAIHWNERSEPAARSADDALEAALAGRGLAVRRFEADLLFDPDSLRTKTGGPPKVFTPFWRRILAQAEPAPPSPAPTSLLAPASWPASIPIDELGLRPTIRWDGGLAEAWSPGRAGAERGLDAFLDHRHDRYTTGRNLPAEEGVSALSPHLRFGELSAREAWHAATDAMGPPLTPDVDHNAPRLAWVRQLAWREFARHQLIHFPHTPAAPLQPRFADFPWWSAEGAEAGHFAAWTRGRTGVPLVDAGMRQLWTTGWMHNRVRMVVASFLVKNLLIHWLEGARWFWDTLVDADLANNTLGWQWAAGCGADAAPFFRIFNPVSQGKRYDADGVYVRRWVPELAALPDRWIHQPWAAPGSVLAEAGVRLGADYPEPVVDLSETRKRALATFKQHRTGGVAFVP